ncbi:MAG TPA: TIGR03668 family PPOX class F420-dependent oxidoreductase [Nitrososphaera sp.]|nr:TIGR03668 family PPOX class F420-dependent oxidoreductase [Nitrososphaera sp.]
MNISPPFKEFIQRARVARLATVDSEFKPHIVPVVFVFDGNHFFIPVDEKRKAAKPEKLKRISNIQDNPNVALLIDQYDEDWTKLFFVMIQGKALVASKREGDIQVRRAYSKLMTKYVQYQKVGVGEMCIKITPKKMASWGNS